MYKNLSEIVAYTKRLWSKVVVPKKNIFSLQVTVFNRRKQFFSVYSASLFHESNWGYPFLRGYGIL